MLRSLVDRTTAGRPYVAFHRKWARINLLCPLLACAGEFVSSTDRGFEQLRRNIFRAAEHFGEDRHLRRFLDDQIGAGCRGGIRAERQHAVIFQQHGFGIFVALKASAMFDTDSAEPRGPYLASGMPSVISERTNAS